MEKADITPALVRCLLATQFPELVDLPVSTVELDGWDNTTFRLGDNMSVRLPSADAYVAQVDKEHRWLPVLADHLPLSIPRPLARGVPGCGYPRPWSIYRWVEGQHATIERIADLTEFTIALAEFLAALYLIDTTGGPPPGRHSFYRGGPLSTYDAETRAAIGELADQIDNETATRVWEAALLATWSRRPVWVHGDVAPSNLLVVDGRLSTRSSPVPFWAEQRGFPSTPPRGRGNVDAWPGLGPLEGADHTCRSSASKASQSAPRRSELRVAAQRPIGHR